MAYYIPSPEKGGGHVPRVPHQISAMAAIHRLRGPLGTNKLSIMENNAFLDTEKSSSQTTFRCLEKVVLSDVWKNNSISGFVS